MGWDKREKRSKKKSGGGLYGRWEMGEEKHNRKVPGGFPNRKASIQQAQDSQGIT